jgi:hypothetical protein
MGVFWWTNPAAALAPASCSRSALSCSTTAAQTLAWCVIVFASAGASAAYLTVSEIFLVEVRAQAIAVCFAIAQCFGAIVRVRYGHLLGDGTDRSRLFVGNLIGAAVMVIGDIVELVPGVRAERKRWRPWPGGCRRSPAGPLPGCPARPRPSPQDLPPRAYRRLMCPSQPQVGD